MGLFSFFKKDKVEEISNTNNEFLDIETSMYDTEAESSAFKDNIDYHELVYNPPQNNISNYKATRNNIGVVVDKDQFGYNTNGFNPNVVTYELEKDSEEEKLEVHNNYQEHEQKEVVALEEVKEIVLPVETMEEVKEPEFNNNNEQNSNVYEIKNNFNDINEDVELSLFGSKDNIGRKIDYDNIDYKEDPIELNNDVKMTKDGYKICPNCGTILNPDAPICFMCSNSFIKK